jgi:SAM-dependent methyltransferase
VLDLGCGVGDQAAELADRGARVIGIDLNEELLSEARSKGIPDAEFRAGDLRVPLDVGVPADGIWSSFAAAYFTDFAGVLEGWAGALKPDAWIALTEIDDLFGHDPLDSRTRTLLDAFAEDALGAGRYDFRMGRRLPAHLEGAGFRIDNSLILEDAELAFQGPARPEVIEAWRLRFERMNLLRDFCGSEYGRIRDEFLGCLARSDHRSRAKVCCRIASK